MKKFLFAAALLSVLTVSGVNIADYGAGPMLKPGRTFYVSTRGSNKNDGKSLKTAFRSIEHGASKLRAGDTLLIEGGEYFGEQIQSNVKENSTGFSEQCGTPGAPIRIMGMKGHTVILRGGKHLKRPADSKGQLCKFKFTGRLWK